MKMTKDLLRLLRPDIDAALAAVGKKHGLQLKSGNCSFTETNATFKLEVSTLDESGAVVTKERSALLTLRASLGFDEADLTREIPINGKKWVLHGYINTGRALPIICSEVGTGKLACFRHEAVLRALGKQTTGIALS